MEAEYESRISKVESEVKDKHGKMNSMMSELKTNVKVADSKSTANNQQIELMNSRLDTYMSKLKDDVDKITNKNRVLFEDFMDRTRDVDLRYIEMEKRIQSQYDFFSENKLRYQQSIDRMEQLGVQLKTQEDTSDKHV